MKGTPLSLPHYQHACAFFLFLDMNNFLPVTFFDIDCFENACYVLEYSMRISALLVWCMRLHQERRECYSQLVNKVPRQHNHLGGCECEFCIWIEMVDTDVKTTKKSPCAGRKLLTDHASGNVTVASFVPSTGNMLLLENMQA